MSEITNDSARLITAEVLDLAPDWFRANPRRDYLDYPAKQYEWGSTALEYQQWVRAQLQRTELAKLIPGGLDLLPDIYAELPETYRRFEWELRPRSHRQLTQHLLLYLDWYIHPEKAIPASALAVTLPRRLPLLVQSANIAAIATIIFSPLLFFAWVPLFLLWAAAVPEADLKVGIHTRRLIHVSELYFYLRESYADPPEDAPVGLP